MKESEGNLAVTHLEEISTPIKRQTLTLAVKEAAAKELQAAELDSITEDAPLLIDQLELPLGLRSLDQGDLTKVAHELRAELIATVAQSGGHLASSLGAAEITVALHHCFNTPDDRIVWDIGHQAYIHKMITGRRSRLSQIRKQGGISGFLKREESIYDTFGAGHAGTSISAAIGMRTVLQQENSEQFVVAVIGDASITSGMALEALNNAGALGLKKLIVVLNDNEMSISPSVGALSWLFSHAVTSRTSNLIRTRFKNLYRAGYVPEVVYKAVDRVEELTQGFFASASMLFESFGFRYIGPVDGHDVGELVKAFEHAKTQDVPVLIHTYTVKGKGYEPAEEDPITWHGVVPFDPTKGAFLANKQPVLRKAPTFTSVFAGAITDLAAQHEKLVAITAGTATGTGLDQFQKVHPDRFFDVGICEQHAVTFAAGMACEGYKPVCAIYSTFLQRSYDQIVHDVCIQNLPVVFALDRAGVVGNDGETHHGVFDIAYFRTVPNIVIMSPKDEQELRDMLFTAVRHNGPVAIRYPRGTGTGVTLRENFEELEIGKAEVLQEGSEVALIAFGPLVNCALSVASSLAQYGVPCTVINARFAKPLDTELFSRVLADHGLVALLEDHALAGGFSSAILEYANDAEIRVKRPILRFGVRDEFVTQASQDQQYAEQGYDAKGVLNRILSALKV